MPIKLPTSFTAGRKVTIFGVTYQPGAAVPKATVKQIKDLSALLASRILIPNIDPHGRIKMKPLHRGPMDLGTAPLRNKL